MDDVHTFTCTECGHMETWSNRHAAGCAATWHVYAEHRALFIAICRTPTPTDPRPETVGELVEVVTP